MSAFWIVTGSIGTLGVLATLGPKAWNALRAVVHLADNVGELIRQVDPANPAGIRAAVDRIGPRLDDHDERLEAVEAVQPRDRLEVARGQARARRHAAVVPG